MVLTWNGGAQRSFGWAAEEIIGRHVSTLYTAEAAGTGHAEHELTAAVNDGRYEEEGWRVRKDGSRFWADVVITPLRDQSGRLRGFAKVVRDLSERLWGQELHAVLDAASDAILGVDEADRVVFANRAAQRVFGYGSGELTGIPLGSLLPEAAAAADLNARRRDGRGFPAEVALTTVDTPRGRTTTVNVRDLTEHRRQEEALRLSEERLRTLVRHSPVGQFEATLDGVIAWANPALEALLGAGPAELDGRRWADLLPTGQHDSLAAELRRLRHGSADSYTGEQLLTGVDGRTVAVQAAAAVVRDSAGHPVRLVGTVVDNTARNAARRQLERTSTQLAVSQRMVGLGSWEQDVETGEVIWSDELYRLVGLTPGARKITYDTFFDYVQPVDRAAIESAARTAARTDGAYALDVDIVRTDGERRTVSLRREVDESGPAPVLRGTILDVTEARALERELRSATDVFAGVLGATTETAIIGTDCSGLRITFMNVGAERMLGWTAAELLGSSPVQLHEPAELAALAAELGVPAGEDPFRELIRQGLEARPRDWTYLMKDGRRRRVRLSITVLGGRSLPTGHVGVAVPLGDPYPVHAGTGVTAPPVAPPGIRSSPAPFPRRTAPQLIRTSR
jgi:PAS domain S-box-containing protein